MAYTSQYSPRYDFKKAESGFETAHAGVVGVPVVVYVVLVFIGSGDSEDDVLLFGLRERYPLTPKTADGYHHFQSVTGNVVQCTCEGGVLKNGIDNYIVPVDFFKCDFPFAMAFFSIAGDLRKKGGAVAEP